MTTLILLDNPGRPFRAEVTLSLAHLSTMQPQSLLAGYIVREHPPAIGSSVLDLTPANAKVSHV